MKRVLLLILLAIASDGLGAEARPAAADPAPKNGGATEDKPPGFNFFNLPPAEKPAPPAAPPTPAAPITPAAPPASPPPAAPAVAKQPTVKEVRSLDELLLPVPLDQDLFTDGRVNPAAVEAANAVVDRATGGKPIAVRVPFRDLIASRWNGYAFRLRGEPQPLTLRGRKVTGHVEVLFRADQSAALGRLGKGSMVPVKGIVRRAEITGDLRNLYFKVVIADGAMQ